MFANDAVFHRRNKPIQDAIDGQNFKQALQLIEKRMKKGEDTRFLRAWKAHVLFRHADGAHHQRGIDETLALCKVDPPATDLETLDILYDTLQKMGGQADAMRSIWERASKAKPQDLDLQMKWFEYAFDGDDWKSAQKAAMTLQSNFPKDRKYYFWAIFLSYLVSVDDSSSETERKLFGTLAYRMASKAADSVPSDPKELLSPPRAIQNAEELLLLAKIFESQGRHSELVSILNSETVGISSRIIQNDWSFVGEKLSSLEKAQMWTEGLSYTKSLLAIPNTEDERKALQEHDDWAVWSLLVAAVRNINNQETLAETQKFIDGFIEYEPKSRNAQLARLDLIHFNFQSGSLKADELVAACQGYFYLNKNKLYCFGDLQTYLSALDKDSLSKFVEYTAKNQGETSGKKNDPFKGVAAINGLKFEYCFLLSADESNVTKSKVEEFASRCLQKYRDVERPERDAASSTIESQPSDDLLLLAAMSLIRFGETLASTNQEQVLNLIHIRAAAILERLLQDSPHNYQALLLLVRIYLRLGAGSLALKTFSKLSVKQIQFETVAHNLFTRLATIHPQSAPPIEGAEYKDFNPQSAFVQALNFYRTADITTVRHRSKGLDLGSYVNIEGTIDLQKRLKNSICRRLWALEVRRIQRLVGGDPMGHEDIARDTSPLVDQRVFDAFMNCEAPGKPTLEERVRLGPLPQEQWVKSTRMADELFGLLKNIILQKPITAQHELPTLEDLVGSNAASEMTGSEIEGAKVNLNLFRVAVFLGGSKSVSPEQVESSLTEVEEWLNEKSRELTVDDGQISGAISNTAIFLKSETPTAPSWKSFHDLFVVLESLKAVIFIATIVSRKGFKIAKASKDQVTRLGESARQVHQAIRVNVRTLKSRISEPGMLGSLIDLVGGGDGKGEVGAELRAELEKTMDTSAVEIFCGELMESWEEGLTGLFSVTL
ncbi:cytoskeleton organization protein [Aspergillus steynii IBT 23096]|uniref:Cytoskeleton organization protein n=1 Tax=Aspergillus steynii IBT 23096 TaxID=1392250 RepID=A0A2I2GNM1_9EURO|nr:cytoskeleton organization protein [Aspergillus steynii IBT 23096]PLB54463.1 cytoskeleton organization protein [Aspergillus steynii IBT 23096]